MSGGRLDFGIGKGYRHSEFAGFCTPYEQAQARFEEALQVIIKAWTSNERFSHNGTFWQYEDIIVEPPTSLFKAECEARGRTFNPMDVAVARNLYVARDTVDAQAALARLAASGQSREFPPPPVGAWQGRLPRPTRAATGR